VIEKHGQKRTDDYFWLREREDEAVLSHLRAENAYADAVLAPTSPLQETIFQEIVARIPQADESVPVFENGWHWLTRYEPGKEYPIYVRKQSLDAPDQIVLDVNELAKGHNYFSVPGLDSSDSGDLIVFAVDTVGRRKYDLHFKNLKTGEILPDVIDDVTPNAVWAADEKTVLYSRQDPETLRSFQIWRHQVGTDPKSDVLVYEEKDEEFNSYVYRSKSKKYVMIGSSQTLSDEVRYLDALNPAGELRVLEPRKRGREYSADHLNGFFYVRTNDGGRNFRLMRAPESAPGFANWSEVVPHRDDVFLDSFELFNDYLVLGERKDGLMRLHIMPWGGEGHFVDFGEPAYVARISANPEANTRMLRFVYSSLTTPSSTYDYDMASKEKILRKREQVGGGFDPANYTTERIWAPARDGRRVPISLVYRKGFQRNATAPLLLYGYGSYGYSSDPNFNGPSISLLDRGFVYAIAHIRGGQELGREWYEEGKLLNKMNTFTDFIDAAEFLVGQKYADPDKVFAMGGSAGGLLVGAVMNLRPDLWKGVVARVPFVDVVTTMLDDTIPLTTSEYDEWGNPNDPVYFDYMLSYSPYDQIQPKAYPNILLTTGFHDSQVQYFEPAKWVAKLRATKTDSNLLLLRTYMEAGHGGASGRFRRQEETALAYAFFLSLSAR
jgi:oligopeptidase B